jgi:alkaline phosphatase
MKRRTFFRQSSVAAAGLSFLLPNIGNSQYKESGIETIFGKNKKAKNIIFLVSDGMSSGTLTMADIFLYKKNGRGSNWLQLYRENKVKRAYMDMASASSSVTDSAAASSSWGSGVRVKNGRVNMGEDGQEYLPIWQKFKKSGKKAGCVTTAPITHATPAGFCVNSITRGEQSQIAAKYLDLRFDVMLGGGEKYFVNEKKGINLFPGFAARGYEIVKNSREMQMAIGQKPIIGVFDHDGLPYELDRINKPDWKQDIPSLAEMTRKAIDVMKSHPQGFCLQVEGGKVDWAAHANDAFALLYDQIAFDEAIQVAMDFAEKDGNTLVIITTDHGNANPGLYYGKEADRNFESMFSARHTTHYLLNEIKKTDSIQDVADKIKTLQGYSLEEAELKAVLQKYSDQSDESAYNEYKLPYELYGQLLRKYTSVHFGGTEHTADYTELAMFGPGSQRLQSFIKNTDLHYFMLEAAEVENTF